MGDRAAGRKEVPMEGLRPVIISGILLAAVLLAGAAAGRGSNLQFTMSGNILTITGSTNLAAGDRLFVEVVPAEFTPTVKGNETGFSGSSGTVFVQPGSPLNTFRFAVNVSAFSPGMYLVTVKSLETEFQESGQFVLPWTPVPTEIPASPGAVSPPSTPPSSAVPSLQAPPAPPTQTPLPAMISPGAVTVATCLFLYRR